MTLVELDYASYEDIRRITAILDELDALRECVKAADALRATEHRVRLAHWSAYDEARAKLVDKPARKE